jgi:hypothetical protein
MFFEKLSRAAQKEFCSDKRKHLFLAFNRRQQRSG